MTEKIHPQLPGQNIDTIDKKNLFYFEFTQKRKLLSFTHQQVIPNLYDCLSTAEQKKKIFWRMWVTKHFLFPIDFYCVFELFGYPHSS